MRLIDNCRTQLTRLWSLQVAALGVVFWGALSGLWVVWPAFVDWIPLWFYAVGGIAMSIALAIARVLKQPGVEQ